MGTYETIDHTADVGIVARASTLAELFETAAEGMFSFIVDPTSAESRVWLERTVEADDLEGLLAAWLNCLLTLFGSEQFVPKAFVVDDISERRLRATIHGEPAEAGRHRFRGDVKAATYHQLEVAPDGGGWKARVIFDV